MDAPKFGKLMKKSEMGDPKVGRIGVVGKLVRKIEMGGPQEGKVMKKIQMNEPKVGTVGDREALVKRSTRNLSRVRCWQELARSINSSSVLTTSLERSCFGML